MLFIILTFCSAEDSNKFWICNEERCNDIVQKYDNPQSFLEGLKDITGKSYIILYQDIEINRNNFPDSDYKQFLKIINSHSHQIDIRGANQEPMVKLTLSGFDSNDGRQGNYLALDNLEIIFAKAKVNISSISIGANCNIKKDDLELNVIDINLYSKYLDNIKSINFIRLTINGNLSDSESTTVFNQRIEYGESNLIYVTLSDVSSAKFSGNKFTIKYESKQSEFTLPNYNFTAAFIFDLVDGAIFSIEGDAPIDTNYNNFLYVNPLGERCDITVKDTNIISKGISIDKGKLTWDNEKKIEKMHLGGNVEFSPLKTVNTDSFEYFSSGKITGNLNVVCSTLSFKDTISAPSMTIKTSYIMVVSGTPPTRKIDGKLIIYNEKIICDSYKMVSHDNFIINSRYKIIVNDLEFENNPVIQFDSRSEGKNHIEEGLIVKNTIVGRFRLQMYEIPSNDNNDLATAIYIKTEKALIDLQSVSFGYIDSYGYSQEFSILEICNDYSFLNGYTAGRAIGFKQTKEKGSNKKQICFSDNKVCPKDFDKVPTNGILANYITKFIRTFYFYSTEPSKFIDIDLSLLTGTVFFVGDNDEGMTSQFRLKSEANEYSSIYDIRFSGKINIEFATQIKFDNEIKFQITGNNIKFNNLGNVLLPKRNEIRLFEFHIKDLNIYKEYIKKFDHAKITDLLEVDSFEFIDAGWNITESGKSYTINGIDLPNLYVNILFREIKLSTTELKRINFYYNSQTSLESWHATIDAWDTADYNPFSNYDLRWIPQIEYVFGSSYVPIACFYKTTYFNCSDPTVKELRVENDAYIYDTYLRISEGSEITKVVFEKIFSIEESFEYEPSLLVEFSGGVTNNYTQKTFEISQNISSGFLIVNSGEVYFKNIKTPEKINGLVSFYDIDQFFEIKFPSILADKYSVDPTTYEINVTENLELSANEFITNADPYFRVTMKEKCGYDYLEYLITDVFIGRSFLIFESTKTFQEIEKIVKFTNNKHNLKIKDLEIVFEKDLKNLVYSSKGDDYQPDGEGTRITDESRYFINQYYLKFASLHYENDKSNQKSSLPNSAIAGIAVGCVAFVAIVIIVPIVICKFKKKNDSSVDSK